jgi:hypothetical protein
LQCGAERCRRQVVLPPTQFDFVATRVVDTGSLKFSMSSSNGTVEVLYTQIDAMRCMRRVRARAPPADTAANRRWLADGNQKRE